MKRTLTLILSLSLVLSCKADKPGNTAKAEGPQWTAEVSELDSSTSANVEVKTPGAADFAPWRGGQPIPAQSIVRTPATVKATLSLPNAGKLTLNHSSIVELTSRAKLALTAGQAVLEYPPTDKGDREDVTVVLPAGEVVLHGTKVSLVAGEKDSTVTVTQGLVEVRHGGEAFEGRAGQEILLRKGAEPVITQAPDLGRRFGWSELGEREPSEGIGEVPRGLGKLVGKVPGGETEHRLDLVKHDVHVKIRGNLAYTEITEAFKNPLNQTLEGVYRFPLPSDGRISRLALKVGDRVMEGEFLETQRAEQIWRDVIDRWRDPAMLKWKEGNTFELRIFPIDPHQTREVTIGYVQRLEPSVGGYTYTYPMPVDRAGLIPAKHFGFEAELYGHDATQPLDVIGYPAFVETGATKSDQAMAKIRYSQEDFVADGDLSIRFGRRDAVGLRAHTFAEKGKDPYAVLVMRPDLPAQKEIKPRDFVVVVDRSLSRTGAALELQRRLVPRMIREMDPLDRVTVVACNERCTPAGPAEFQPARIAAADAVQLALLDVQAEGATYPVEAIRVAAALFRRRKDQKREAHVVYFTDGVASVGELRPGKLAEAVQRTLLPFNARMSVVDVGGNTDDLALDALASAGRGRVVALDPMLSATGQALEILNAHYRAILERPTLQLPPGVTAEMTLPTAIASGDEIVVAARFAGPVTGEAVLSGKLNGNDYVLRYPIDLKPSTMSGNTFVPGEWAAQRIASLELDPGDHQKEIVDLSKTYGVLSRFTTLLALEDREMMNEYGVRQRERTQWSGDESADEEAESADEEPAPPRPRASTARRKAANRHKSKQPAKPAPYFALGEGSAPKKEARPAYTTKGSARGLEKALDLDSPPRPVSKPTPTPTPYVGDDAFASGSSELRMRPTHYDYQGRYHLPRIQIAAASPPTEWERRNVRNHRAKLGKDRTNRSKRMSLIRAMVRADDISGARAETRDWLDTNPMDPEAIVQMAQIQAQRGDLAAFYAGLVSAADAAPRGRWLQERIHAAARADGDEAMACAMAVALESTEKRPPKDPADILACPMTTAVGPWFGEPGPNPVPAAVEDTNLKGSLVVKLKSMGGDWDIVVLEPSGRPIWWGSARQRLKVANVVGADRTEVFALPSLRRGTYSIKLVPRSGSAGDVLEVAVNASRGASRTFNVTAPSSEPFEVAEVTN